MVVDVRCISCCASATRIAVCEWQLEGLPSHWYWWGWVEMHVVAIVRWIVGSIWIIMLLSWLLMIAPTNINTNINIYVARVDCVDVDEMLRYSVAFCFCWVMVIHRHIYSYYYCYYYYCYCYSCWCSYRCGWLILV